MEKALVKFKIAYLKARIAKALGIKAKILMVGTVNKNGEPEGWCFDCRGMIPGIEITDDEILWGGYTVQELSEIARHANSPSP